MNRYNIVYDKINLKKSGSKFTLEVYLSEIFMCSAEILDSLSKKQSLRYNARLNSRNFKNKK